MQIVMSKFIWAFNYRHSDIFLVFFFPTAKIQINNFSPQNIYQSFYFGRDALSKTAIFIWGLTLTVVLTSTLARTLALTLNLALTLTLIVILTLILTLILVLILTLILKSEINDHKVAATY